MERHQLGGLGYPRDAGSTEQKQNIGDTEAANSATSKVKTHPRTTSCSFAGRIGGNQAFIVDRNEDPNSATLVDQPDAAPGMSFKEQFDCRPFRSLGLWKAAVIEGVGQKIAPDGSVKYDEG